MDDEQSKLVHCKVFIDCLRPILFPPLTPASFAPTSMYVAKDEGVIVEKIISHKQSVITLQCTRFTSAALRKYKVDAG
jgi:hypothetical protein